MKLNLQSETKMKKSPEDTCNQNKPVTDCDSDDPQLIMLSKYSYSLPTVSVGWDCEYFDQQNNVGSKTVPVFRPIP